MADKCFKSGIAGGRAAFVGYHPVSTAFNAPVIKQVWSRMLHWYMMYRSRYWIYWRGKKMLFGEKAKKYKLG